MTSQNRLESALVEIEAHVNAGGWDQRPALFAFVQAARFAAGDPDTAARLGIDQLDDDTLTPVEQEELPDDDLDHVLASIAWPAEVSGCALTQEIVILPPDAEQHAHTTEQPAMTAEDAARHPDRREARLTVGVMRAGASASLLRLRNPGPGESDDLLTGSDLAPNLVAALLATLD